MCMLQRSLPRCVRLKVNGCIFLYCLGPTSVHRRGVHWRWQWCGGPPEEWQTGGNVEIYWGPAVINLRSPGMLWIFTFLCICFLGEGDPVSDDKTHLESEGAGVTLNASSTFNILPMWPFYSHINKTQSSEGSCPSTNQRPLQCLLNSSRRPTNWCILRNVYSVNYEHASVCWKT